MKKIRVEKLTEASFAPFGSVITTEGRTYGGEAGMYNWYEKQAKTVIPKRVRFYAEQMGETFGNITIKNQKKRWGSCSSARNLNFNRRLIMAPQEVMDYVIVHELCHLRQMNHSNAFWQEVEMVLPDYKMHKKWLETYAQLLNF